MKRIISAILILILLVCMVSASAGTAGSSSEPLISLSYMNGAYKSTLLGESEETVTARLSEVYESSAALLQELYTNSVGYNYAPNNTELSLLAGQKITLITGGSFILLSGSAVLTLSQGCVVNASTGYEVSSGSLLVLNQKYVCAEDTTATVTASVDSFGQLQGYYSTDGTINPYSTMFKDVRKTDWFYPAIDFVYTNGLFAGTSADTFSPGTPMTRAMFVTVLYRLDGKPYTAAVSEFTDVTDMEQYYYYAVSWASENGIVAGYEDGTFMPDMSITREQMALIMYRYASFKGSDISASGEAYDMFPDRAGVSVFAVEAMRWAVSQGVINGSDGELLPLNTATRAQVAQIIFNFCEKLSVNEITTEEQDT